MRLGTTGAGLTIEGGVERYQATGNEMPQLAYCAGIDFLCF
jgi:hypothetical protein